MKLTEKILLDNYDGLTNCGSKISIVNNERIDWEYRYYHEEGAAVCSPNVAEVITLEYGRTGKIKLDDNCRNHPVIAKIISDEAKIWGDEVPEIKTIQKTIDE